MKILFTFILLGSSFLFQSCSTIVSGTTQTLSINSNVDGAEVFLNGQSLGTTPVIQVRVKRVESYNLTVKKEGYKDYNTTLQTRLDNWFWGNILIGGFLGSTTDKVSGTTHLLDPNNIYVKLQPLSGTEDSTRAGTDPSIKDFVITSYDLLVKDINRGQGNYLNTIFKLSHFKDKNTYLKKLKALLTLHEGNIIEFAKAVSNLKE